MRKHLFLLLAVLLLKHGFSQLLPTIGLNTIPANTVAVCQEPWYLGNYYTSGLLVGDTVPEFKLYNLNSDSIVLSNELSSGKPILLIAGSLTCPVFRNKVNTINQVIATYGSAIKVFVIYTLEAHPTDTSVYFGYVNITTQNTSAGVLFQQPTSYAARKHLVDTMSHWVSLNAPVFIDGPCNQWWNTFGPAPNNAYIISPTGIVLKKHGWFDKAPDDIFCDIDNVLSITSGSCITTTAVGNFSLNIINSFVSGDPGHLLYDYAKVANTQSVPVTIKAKKTQKNHPLAWQTAFCADVCYSTADDSITFTLAPFDSLLLSLDFFTDAIPDSGSVKVGFRNINNSNNSYSVRFRASTLPQDVGVYEETNNEKIFSLFPNPAKNQVTIVTEEKEFTVFVRNVLGELVYTSSNEFKINITDLKTGVYSVMVKTKTKNNSLKLIVVN